MAPGLLSAGILSVLLAAGVVRAAVTPVTIQELEQRYQKGGDTVYVVNFWATWCRPCVKELPHFDSLQRAYQAIRPVRVLLVSVDDPKDREKVAKFLAARSYTPQSYIVSDGNPSKWIDAVDTTWSGAIPATLFVRNNGKHRRFVEEEFSYQHLEQTFLRFCKDTQ